uniref:RAB6-interacting golgin n=1 Tax=Leptobrachium leishanense TaxID=445787 RepID=A0A8C5QEP3_9ANUR
MAGWAGFSEEELRRLKGKLEPQRSADHSRRQPAGALTRQQIQRKKALQLQSEQLVKEDGSLPASKEMQLSKPRLAPLPLLTEPTCTTKIPGNLPHSNAAEQHSSPTSHDVRIEQGEAFMELKEKPSIDQRQMEQRLMEEKNKRKKAVLAKAIAERSKKTQAEAVKLKRIQMQLQALDDLVSTDIGILRTRIEQACVQFSQAKHPFVTVSPATGSAFLSASSSLTRLLLFLFPGAVRNFQKAALCLLRKRFDKAETEYILAKMDLHKKTEIKEQLTEHLCTIIQENELRKANRLEELMKQLDVETDDLELELEIEVEQMLEQQETETKKPSEEPKVEQEGKLATEVEIGPRSSIKEGFDNNDVPAHTLLLATTDKELKIEQNSNTAPDG